MVKLVLPVHHVGAPAVELGLPLALRLVQRVCGQGARQVGGGGHGEGWGTDMGRGMSAEGRKEKEGHVGWWKGLGEYEKDERPEGG